MSEVGVVKESQGITRIHDDRLLENERILSGEVQEMRPVIDQRAYEQYMRLSEAIKQIPSVITCSIPGLTLDLKQGRRVFQRTMEKYKFAEQESHELWNRQKVFDSCYNRLRYLEIQAFGGRYGESGSNQVNKRILQEKKDEILQLAGKYYDAADVLRVMVTQWGYVDFPKDALHKFYSSHRQEIDQLREEFRKDFSRIRLSHKAGRLEEYSKHYRALDEKYQEKPVRDDMKLMLQILRHIKDEVDGDTLKIEAKYKHEIEVTLNHHIQHELLNGMVINEIVIARAAARLNVNGSYIMERLRKSIYSNMTGLGGKNDNPFEVNPPNPSALSFDWNKIEAEHAHVEAIEMQQMKDREPTEEDIRTGQAYKEQLELAQKDRETKLTNSIDQVESVSSNPLQAKNQ